MASNIDNSWCRPVWIEYPKGVATEYEETIPRNWVKGKIVYWPNHMNFTRAYENQDQPNETWKQFELVKFRVKEGSKFSIHQTSFKRIICGIILSISTSLIKF